MYVLLERHCGRCRPDASNVKPCILVEDDIFGTFQPEVLRLAVEEGVFDVLRKIDDSNGRRTLSQEDMLCIPGELKGSAASR